MSFLSVCKGVSGGENGSVLRIFSAVKSPADHEGGEVVGGG